MYSLRYNRYFHMTNISHYCHIRIHVTHNQTNFCKLSFSGEIRAIYHICNIKKFESRKFIKNPHRQLNVSRYTNNRGLHSIRNKYFPRWNIYFDTHYIVIYRFLFQTEHLTAFKECLYILSVLSLRSSRKKKTKI